VLANAGAANKIQGNRSVVQHVSYVTAKGSTYLAVATSNGFQLWTPNGETMVHFFTLSSVYPVGTHH
jgi:hypothetical protein